MIVLGIDPGLGTTGWAVVTGDAEHPELRAFGAIRTKPQADPAHRLLQICETVRELLREYQPDQVAIEDVFLAKDTRAALALGQARGAAVVGAALGGVPVSSYTALQIKQSVTGYGHASKEQVGYMVEQLLHLAGPPKPADCADAAAIALCHLHRQDQRTMHAAGVA
ncbi:MAG: crossover junction endodeoxyribonuclease RuvC [candidate division Zixibacteria bacterium]|nr:crossover junction endodeoxyribonuclease RuvC [candidate division Zixibacteria bacterium]